MGCGPSHMITATPEEKKRSAMIEEELKKARFEMRSEIKMLMLGAGESGKSTLVKQMRLIYRAPYTVEERMAFRNVIFANTLQSMQAALSGFEVLGVKIPVELLPLAKFILSQTSEDVEGERLDPQVSSAILMLWRHEALKYVVRNSGKFQLNDSAQYFFTHLRRFASTGYTPSDQDILRTRVRSTGILEEKFHIKGYSLRVFDVGGQRSERKKWIHCFENVHVVVFVAAISEYDQKLWEDERVNRVDEATNLFGSLSGSRWFEKSAFVLLMNKMDIFIDKLPHSPLEYYYPNYTGGSNLEKAKDFMLKKFMSVTHDRPRRHIYTHFTCATDTVQAKVVMAAVFDTVISNMLIAAGIF